MANYFITGTGTDIGKTWLTCALIRHGRATGILVQAYKPVMSGFDPGALEGSDAGQLLLAQGAAVTPEAVAAIAPWRFSAPLSPDQAAAKEGRDVPFDALVAWNRRLASADLRGLVLTEGVGGVCVPLDTQHLVLDWMVALGQPIVLVTGSYLGSMSHTLTALLALRSRGLAVAAIAVNESEASTVGLGDTVASLRAHVGAVPIVAIRRAAPAEGIAALASILLPAPPTVEGQPR